MTEFFFYIIGFIALLTLDIIVVMANVGISNAVPARLLSQGGTSEPRARMTMELLFAQSRYQAGLRLAQIILRATLVGLTLAFTISQTTVTLGLVAFGILLLFAILLFWLEWLLRGIVLKDPESWALRLVRFIQGLNFILRPLLLLPQFVTKNVQTSNEETGSMVMDELINLVDAGQQEGLLEQEERKMIHSIFELGDTLAREIMIPRIDIIAFEVNTPLPEAIDGLLRSGYTRVPIYQETIDKVSGLLYAKDLLRVWREGGQLDSLAGLLRPAYFVPEAKKVDQLLAEMQNRRVHMAIVVDEYGGVAGLVTLEDIVEEIIGEIQDEYDQAEELPYLETDEGEYIFQGRVDLDDFNEVLESSLSKEEADTIGGFIYSRVGRVPASGEIVKVDDLLLTVEQVSGRRIRKVRARRVQPDSDQEELIPHADG